jgi:hypothetical protein
MPRKPHDERVLAKARELARQLHSEGWTQEEIRAEFRNGGSRVKSVFQPMAGEFGWDWQSFLKILVQLLPLIFLFF